MPPLISILIAAYNAERWIGDTLRSALAQTWPNKEIIVVDDGSRDRTRDAAAQFAPQGVTVVSQPNQGAAAARNHAFSLCHGDYIQWLDADDLLSPDKLEKQMAASAQGLGPRTLLSCGWGYFMYRPRAAKFTPTALWCDLAPAEWLRRKLADNLCMANATWLVSRELTEAAGPWDTALSLDDDGEYFCRVLLASQGTQFVPGARMYYRRSGSDSLSNVNGSSKKLESQFRSIELHLRYLRSLEDSPETRVAGLRYLQSWPLFFYPERPDLLRQLEALAGSLGGQLERPRLRWKYAWLEKIAGFGPAKRIQFLLPALKWRALRAWDKAMFQMERRKAA